MKIICITNFKGGSGKTTTAYNLGFELSAQHNKNTLLIDNDPQANLTRYFKSIYGGWKKGTDWTKQPEINTSTTFAYIPADPEMLSIDVNQNKAMEYVSGIYQKKRDYIIFDTTPDIGSSFASASFFVASDILIPVEPDQFNLDGLRETIKQAREMESAVGEKKNIWVLITKVNSRYKMDKDIIAKIRKNAISEGYTCFDSTIHTSVKVKEANAIGMSIMTYEKKCRAAIDYKEFVKEFVSKLDTKTIK